MSVEARLQALVQNYRAQFGDAALTQSPQLIAQLSVQAPDLHGEIKALAAAINRGAAARIAAAPDQEAEAARVATEIAAGEKLSMAVATAGVAVARQTGQQAAAPPAPAPAAPASGWAGETIVAAPSPASPTYPPPDGTPGYVPPGSAPTVGQPAPAKPIYQNPVAIGAGAVVAILGFLYWLGSTDPAGNDQGPEPGPQAASSPYPTLRREGTLPTLGFNRDQNGLAILFMLETPRGLAPGVVVLPPNGWNQAPTQIAFGRAGDVPPNVQVANDGSARMQRMQGDGRPARAGQVQWQRDGLGLGSICIAFQNRAGQNRSRDVGLSGTTMCVMDADCQQSTACGRLR